MQFSLSSKIMVCFQHLPKLLPTAISRQLSSTRSSSAAWQQAVQRQDPKQAEFYHKEKLIMVDAQDRMIGSISKGEAHVIDVVKKGVYHRALSLLIFDEQDRFLLTQRASCKITFPDYFTNACCSHPLFEPSELEENEDAIGVKRATIRRSNYELGTKLDHIHADELKFMNKLSYRAASDGGEWGEAEIDYIFVLRKNLDLNPNPEEVKSFRYVSKTEMQDLLENHRRHNIKITPWVKLLGNDLLFHYWNNLHQLDKIAQTNIIVHHDALLNTS